MQILAKMIISRLIGSSVSRRVALNGFNILKGLFITTPWIPLITTLTTSFSAIWNNSSRVRTLTSDATIDTIIRSSTGLFSMLPTRVTTILVFMSSLSSILYRISYFTVLVSILFPIRALIANWIFMMTPGIKYYWKDLQWIFNHIYNWLESIITYAATHLNYVDVPLPSTTTTITWSSVIVLIWTIIPTEYKYDWLKAFFSIFPEWSFIPLTWGIENIIVPAGKFAGSYLPSPVKTYLKNLWNYISDSQGKIQGYVTKAVNWLKDWYSK